MTLPGPEVAHRWQRRMLVDRNGEPVGSIETVYSDKATHQPEWALLEASATRRAPTFIPLVSASEEGGTVRVPFDKTLIERAPSVPAGRELSEDKEEELYRHYGVPYSRAKSPSGLPTGEPLPASEPGLPARQATAAGGEPMPAPETLPAGVGPAGELPREATASEPTPLPTGDVPLGARPGASTSESSIVSDTLAAGGRLRITDPRVGAAAAAALTVAAGVWRREAMGRQISMTISRLGTIPATFDRRRRRRRRAKAVNHAATSATELTTTLGRSMARLLGGLALLSAIGAVRGGRRTWASVQAAQRAFRKAGRRLPPAPGRRG